MAHFALLWAVVVMSILYKCLKPLWFFSHFKTLSSSNSLPLFQADVNLLAFLPSPYASLFNLTFRKC